MTQQKDCPDTKDHLAEFQPYLDDVDIPDDQKRAFLELIWSIMVEFVALGFGADATSQAIAAHLSVSIDGDAATNPQSTLSEAFAEAQPTTRPITDSEARV